MISDLDRYHGSVLRQILVSHGRPIRVGVANLSGRIDAFCMDGAAFHIKHSSKRLPPWQFTYMDENLCELLELGKVHNPLWAFLVCGQDGVVGLSLDELFSLVEIGEGGTAWLRVRRSRNAMYRVAGARGELPRAKPRGVLPFLEAFAALVARPTE